MDLKSPNIENFRKNESQIGEISLAGIYKNKNHKNKNHRLNPCYGCQKNKHYLVVTS